MQSSSFKVDTLLHCISSLGPSPASELTSTSSYSSKIHPCKISLIWFLYKKKNISSPTEPIDYLHFVHVIEKFSVLLAGH